MTRLNALLDSWHFRTGTELMESCGLRRHLGESYRGYASDVSEATVRSLFQTRYGDPPNDVFQRGPIWLAGPIPEREEGDQCSSLD